jgi:hypothetical protein
MNIPSRKYKRKGKSEGRYGRVRKGSRAEKARELG